MRKGSGRDALIVLVGSAGAQTISLAVAPLLTRIYTPEQFGGYALFLSITAILGTISCGRYELAIPIPAKDESALLLLGLCFLLSFLVAFISYVPFWLWGESVAKTLNASHIESLLWLIPIASLCIGISTATRYWLLRRKEFFATSKNAIARSALTSAFSLGLGIIGETRYGLIGGMMIGVLAATAIQVWPLIGTLRGIFKPDLWRKLKLQASEHRGFPLYSLASALVETGASQIPNFFLASIFGATPLGQFALATRVSALPLSIISSSIADVFRQRASETYRNKGECRELYITTLQKLALYGIPSFAFVGLSAPLAFSTIFGSEWIQSGEIVQILSIMLCLRFISSPLSVMFYIAEKQAADLVVQLLLFVSITMSFVAIAKFNFSLYAAIVIYATIYTVKYSTELYLSYIYANGKDSDRNS
jgi:O-antigen/teichoic acid export membrane protein